jgi:CelD/BcsL family acetyltransferase involved in cellulose biosynthesis
MTAAGPELEVERVEGGDALESIRAAWDGLLDRNETRTAELTHAWQLTYWEHLAAESRLFVLVVREAGEIVAIAPLKLSRRGKLGIPIRYLEFIAAGESNYQDFIIGRRHQEVLASILKFLLRHRGQWDVLYLRHVPENSSTARFFLDAAGGLDRSVVSTVAGIDRCIFLEMNQTWERYRAGTAKVRNKIASRKRKLQKLGALASFHCSGEQDYRTNLARFFDLHRRRWNGTDTPSQFNDDRQCRFYLEAGLRLLPKKQIDLFMVEMGASPIAGLLTLRYDRRCINQLIAFDPAYAHSSPSFVMHDLFLEELFSNGVREFDFGHYFPYKEAWANSFKNTLDLKVHLGGPVPSYDQMVSTLLQGLRARIRRHEALLKAARAVRNRLRRISTPRNGGAGPGEEPDAG